jgi:hypothetical protein
LALAATPSAALQPQRSAAQPFHTSKPTTALDQTCALQVNAAHITLATASRRLRTHETARAAASTPLQSGAAGCLHRSARLQVAAIATASAHACSERAAAAFDSGNALESYNCLPCYSLGAGVSLLADVRPARPLPPSLPPTHSLFRSIQGQITRADMLQVSR